MKKPTLIREFQELDGGQQLCTIVIVLFLVSALGMLLTGGGDRHNYRLTADEDPIVY